MSKRIREIVEINENLCDGCGLCVPNCAEGAIQIIDGKARLISENLCDGFGKCLGSCPQDAIRIINREAEGYDEEAVENHLKFMKAGEETEVSQKTVSLPLAGQKAHAPTTPGQHVFSGCPGSAMRMFDSPATDNRVADNKGAVPSRLTQWPVQLMLVPPTAPFLNGRELLLAADCCAFAYGDFHHRFIKDKSLLVACPKLDDISYYREKLEAIFRESGCTAVTIVVMEVPCCTGLEIVARQALNACGREIPLRKVVIGIRGEILHEGHSESMNRSA